MECDACGSRNVTRRRIEGYLLEECGLCGSLQGDDTAIALIEDLRAGRARGLDDGVIPLVSALERTGAFRVHKASSGAAGGGEPPYLFLGLTRNDTRPVERLMRSLELANRETQLRWIMELTLQHELVYILRPRFWKIPTAVTAAEIRLAHEDLAILGARLRRDLALSWWRD